MADTAETVYRDYMTDGVPASGKNDPKKAAIRKLLKQYENVIDAFITGGGFIYSSRDGLYADLTKPGHSIAWVMGDPIVERNGIYEKLGNAGTGSWLRLGDLPYSFIIASDVGAGTANAIQATTSIPVSGSALVWMNVFEANTASPVTVLFNGGAALTVKTNSGGNIAAGGLVTGMIVLGVVSGSTFRLLSDQASAAILAAAEAAQAAAESAQSLAEAAQSAAEDARDITLATIPSVLKYGAKLDGDTDDSAAIMATLAAHGVAFIPWTATGFVAGGITLGTNQKIIGERKTIWWLPAAASYGVRVTSDGAGAYGVMEDFLFDLSACPTSTTAIRFGTNSGVVFGFRGRNLDFRYCGEAIGDETSVSNYIVDVQFTDCYCYLTRGRQFYSRRSRGFITLRDFKVDHTFNPDGSPQVTWEGIRFENIVGLELEKVDVLGPNYVTPVLYQAAAIGLVIHGDTVGKASVWLTRVLVDNTRGPGIDIADVFNLFSVNMCAYQNLGSAILLTDVKEAVFSNTSIAGGKGVPGSPGGASGLILQRVTKSKFNNTQIKECDGNGGVVLDCSRVLLTDFSAEGCTGVGYYELGTSNLNQVKGASYLNNTGGNLIQSGAASVHVEWVSSAGALTARTIGAATL